MKKSDAQFKIVDVLLGRNLVGGLADRAMLVLSVAVVALWLISYLTSRSEPKMAIDYNRLEEIAAAAVETMQDTEKEEAGKKIDIRYATAEASPSLSPAPSQESHERWWSSVIVASGEADLVTWTVFFGLPALAAIYFWLYLFERKKENAAYGLSHELLSQDIDSSLKSVDDISSFKSEHSHVFRKLSKPRRALIKQVIAEYFELDASRLEFREVTTKFPLGIERRVKSIVVGDSRDGLPRRGDPR